MYVMACRECGWWIDRTPKSSKIDAVKEWDDDAVEGFSHRNEKK